MKNFEPYHFAWIMAHPSRSSSWLADRLSDGFHVHHMDGDSQNHAPENLVLIECDDHFMIHGSPEFLRRRLTKLTNGDMAAFRKKRSKGRKRYSLPIGPTIVVERIVEIFTPPPTLRPSSNLAVFEYCLY